MMQDGNYWDKGWEPQWCEKKPVVDDSEFLKLLGEPQKIEIKCTNCGGKALYVSRQISNNKAVGLIGKCVNCGKSFTIIGTK